MFTIEDNQHAFKGLQNMSNRSLEYKSHIVTKLLPRIFLTVLGHVYEFCNSKRYKGWGRF